MSTHLLPHAIAGTVELECPAGETCAEPSCLVHGEGGVLDHRAQKGDEEAASAFARARARRGHVPPPPPTQPEGHAS